MTWIKICGITRVEDALEAASLGIDAVGFVFAPGPRKVDPSIVREISQRLSNSVLRVGVFVNQDSSEVDQIITECGLTALQFHGDEPPEYCQRFFLPIIKAIRIKGLESLKEVERFPRATLLLDTFCPVKAGGTGVPFPWEIALKAKERRDIILSGGLNPGNVGAAIESVSPFGVDVSSGVESMPGKKDLSKMVQFVKEVRKADKDVSSLAAKIGGEL